MRGRLGGLVDGRGVGVLAECCWRVDKREIEKGRSFPSKLSTPSCSPSFPRFYLHMFHIPPISLPSVPYYNTHSRGFHSGTFNVTKAVFPYLQKNGGGVILNTSATLQYKATPFQAHASAAKAGIDVLTQTLGVEWGEQNIRVVSIAPGPIAGTVGGPGNKHEKHDDNFSIFQRYCMFFLYDTGDANTRPD